MLNWLFSSSTNNNLDETDDSTDNSLSQSMEVDESHSTNTSSNVLPSNQSKFTIPELLVKALPDVDIHSPNVLMLGEQSSGKTRMIVSLLFYYLIEHPLFTSDMGLLLLKLFNTGNSMVTRRPTTVRFVHHVAGGAHASHNSGGNSSSSTSASASIAGDCNALAISLSYEGQVVSYHSQRERFQQMIEELTYYPDGDELYESEVCIQIKANTVPNSTFTDFPGLTTEDRVFKDSGKTLKQLILEKMKQNYNTLVIVEPCSREDLSTSHICPLLEQCRQQSRPDIFENSVLVLTKCDKKTEISFRKDTLPVILQTSETTKRNYPFKYVVGVMNKFDDDAHEEFQDFTSFEQFKQLFQATRERELKKFSSFPELSTEHHVTTKAVFTAMDRIFHANFAASIENGLVNIRRIIQDYEHEMKLYSAPSPSCYHYYPSHPVVGVYEGLDVITIYGDFYRQIYDVMSGVFSRYDVKSIALTLPAQNWLLNEQNPNNLSINFTLFHKRKEIYENEIKGFARKYVDHLLNYINRSIDQQLQDSKNSPFHRIDRFPRLQQHIQSSLSHAAKSWKDTLYGIVLSYLNTIWQIEEPQGKLDKYERLLTLIHKEIPHVIVTNSFHEVMLCWKKIEIDWAATSANGPVSSSLLLEEDADFRQKREEYETRYTYLRQQELVLVACQGAQSDEDLKNKLMYGVNPSQAFVAQNSFVKEFWNKKFYHDFFPHRQNDLLYQRYTESIRAITPAPVIQARASLASPVVSPIPFVSTPSKRMEVEPTSEISPFLPSLNRFSDVNGNYPHHHVVENTTTNPKKISNEDMFGDSDATSAPDSPAKATGKRDRDEGSSPKKRVGFPTLPSAFPVIGSGKNTIKALYNNREEETCPDNYYEPLPYLTAHENDSGAGPFGNGEDTGNQSKRFKAETVPAIASKTSTKPELPSKQVSPPQPAAHASSSLGIKNEKSSQGISIPISNSQSTNKGISLSQTKDSALFPHHQISSTPSSSSVANRSSLSVSASATKPGSSTFSASKLIPAPSSVQKSQLVDLSQLDDEEEEEDDEDHRNTANSKDHYNLHNTFFSSR